MHVENQVLSVCIRIDFLCAKILFTCLNVLEYTEGFSKDFSLHQSKPF